MIEGAAGDDHGVFTLDGPAVFPRTIEVHNHPRDEPNQPVPVLSPRSTFIFKTDSYCNHDAKCNQVYLCIHQLNIRDTSVGFIHP